MAKVSGNGKGGKQAGKGRATKDAPKIDEREVITIVPDHSSGFSTFYSNYASVSHTNNEFFLDFCLLGLPYNVDLENKSVTTPVVARIIIPPGLIDGLIKALQLQKDKQKETAKQGGVTISREGGKS